MRILVASSNPGKLREYQAMAATHAAVAPPATAESIEFQLLANLESLPPFEESAPTFAENAAGKALHYSRFADDAVIADDSGLVVPALGGAPGVHSARYAGPQASDADRVNKLLADLSMAGAFGVLKGGHAGPPLPSKAATVGADPRLPRAQSRGACPPPVARFVCVLALARQGRALAVFSDCVEGVLLDAPRGAGGFGYDPIFLDPPLGKTFAELSREEKNLLSHRGKAFRKLLAHVREKI